MIPDSNPSRNSVGDTLGGLPGPKGGPRVLGRVVRHGPTTLVTDTPFQVYTRDPSPRVPGVPAPGGGMGPVSMCLWTSVCPRICVDACVCSVAPKVEVRHARTHPWVLCVCVCVCGGGTRCRTRVYKGGHPCVRECVRRPRGPGQRACAPSLEPGGAGRRRERLRESVDLN